MYCDNRLMRHFCEILSISESGSQKYKFSFFLSVLSAEFDYFSNILKQAVPKKVALADNPKRDMSLSKICKKKNNAFFKTVGLEMFSIYYFWIWGLQHLCSINAGDIFFHLSRYHKY